MTDIPLIDKEDVIKPKRSKNDGIVIDNIYKEQYNISEKILDRLTINRPKIGTGKETSYMLSNGIAVMVDYSSWYPEHKLFWHGVDKVKCEKYTNKYDKFYVVLKCQFLGIFPIPGNVFIEWFKNFRLSDGSWKFKIVHEGQKSLIKDLNIDISEYRNRIDMLEDKENTVGELKDKFPENDKKDEKMENNKEQVIKKIKATYGLSPVDKDEQAIIQNYIIKNDIKLRDTGLKDYSRKTTINVPNTGNDLPYGDVGTVIVIDMSNDVWMKKLGNVHNRTQINGVTDIIKLHKKHDYEEKLWSTLGNCYLDISEDVIGTFVISEGIGDYPIVLVDYEHKWKKRDNIEKTPIQIQIEPSIETIGKDKGMIDKEKEITGRDKDTEINPDTETEPKIKICQTINKCLEESGPDDIIVQTIEYINKDRDNIAKSIVGTYRNKVIAEKEAIEKIKVIAEKEAIEKAKEKEKKVDIKQRWENLPNMCKLVSEGKNCNIYGPSGTGKTTKVMEISGELVVTRIEGNTDNLYVEFKNKGYIIFVRIHPGYDYGRFIEIKTFHTEKEGKPTERISHISLPGDLKIASTRALALAIGMNIEDAKNKFWDDVYSIYIEKTKAMTREEIKEMFEYAPVVVLILDEITRGNIQELLGEAGTLMEKDKRLGEINEVTISLKSGDTFGIPSNLYIICTMNTVDASVMGLDVANIRRFNSIPCMPKFEIVKEYIEDSHKKGLISENVYGLLLKFVRALEKINHGICDNEDLGLYRQIGHTHLLDIDSKSKLVDSESKLIVTWNNKILPALEIICRYDHSRINEILFGDDNDDNKKYIQQFESIEDLEKFIDDINGSE